MSSAPKRGSLIGRTIWRILLIVAAALLIAGATAAVEGQPSATRERASRDAPYGPTIPFGLVQFFGQSAIFGAGVLVARRWLRVRL